MIHYILYTNHRNQQPIFDDRFTSFFVVLINITIILELHSSLSCRRQTYCLEKIGNRHPWKVKINLVSW